MLLCRSTVRCVLAGMVVAVSPAIAAPEFESVDAKEIPEVSPLPANEGKLVLAWTGFGEGLTYRLERARGAGFVNPVTLYEGPANDAFVSGLPAGRHYFRVAGSGDPGSWSAPLVVDVTYPSRTQVAADIAASTVARESWTSRTPSTFWLGSWHPAVAQFGSLRIGFRIPRTRP